MGSDDIPQKTIVETETALKDLKNKKLPSETNITTECMIKLLHAIQKLFNAYHFVFIMHKKRDITGLKHRNITE